METGRMVILLNLESLYESLYDALNQVLFLSIYINIFCCSLNNIPDISIGHYTVQEVLISNSLIIHE